MTTVQAEASFRRAVTLTTLTSFLVPGAGLITAPVLAHALDTAGRGELAAALAPASLMLAAATMGLPDGMTFYIAKHPQIMRRALGWMSLITLVLGAVCVAAVFLALPFLRSGNGSQGHLILLAALLTVPALVVGVFRGAAIGAQQWNAVAAERIILTGGRVVSLVALFVVHDLTVYTAVLVNVLLPIFAGVVYAVLLRSRFLVPPNDASGAPDELLDLDLDLDLELDLEHRSFELAGTQAVLTEARARGRHRAPGDNEPAADDDNGKLLRSIVSFGTRVWFGSVASMVLDRAAPLLMVPLSNATNLGLYAVANTVSDLPLIVALAIAGTLYGVNSKNRNIDQITSTSRLSLLVCSLGCAFLAGTIHWWIGPLFGSDFTRAAWPTLILTAGSLIVIPGLMAASALTAWNRPGLRSAGLGIVLVVTLVLFFFLIPRFGVYGACWGEVFSSFLFTGLMVGWSQRIIGVSAGDFIIIRWADAVRLWREGQRARHLAVQMLRG